MHGTYIGDDRMLVQTVWGGKVLVASSDLSLMPDLVTTGTYDVPFTAYLRRELSAGMTAIDVGANVGLFTLLMAWQVGPTGRVVAFEPVPDVARLLRENVGMNYVAGWVDVEERAVAEARGRARIFTTSRFRGNASLTQHDEAYARMTVGLDEVRSTEVELVPLDDLAGRVGRVDLVKIDVEGAESRVLVGMRGLIADGAVERISVEVSRGRSGDDWAPLVRELRALREAGWSLATIDDEGTSQPLEIDVLVEVGQYSQVLLRRGGAVGQ